MKKACLILMIITVIAVMGFSLIGCNNKEETNDNLCYDIKINLTENKLTGEQTVSYNNVYCENLTESVFHLYPNAYAENAKNKAYVIEPSVYGGIEVTSVKSGENNVEYTISECGEYLTVKHGEVKKNDNISLKIEYSVTLPSCNLRLGYVDGYYNLSGFYPQLSVYGENGFRQDAYSAVGDPILSTVATYNVEFDCDKSLVVASSLKCKDISTTTNRQLLKYSGENVRDFAFACNSNYNVINGQAGGVNVYYFYTADENAQETLNTTIKAINTFSEAFGAYPYDTYSVARVPFDCDGMEYSGLVYVAEKCSDLTEAVIHETAHQWWYGMVGNDCINESYMDEGLVTFCSAYYYELNGESEKFKEKINAIKRAYINYENLQKRRNTGMNLAMDKPIYEYTDYQYTMVIYYKGSMMFNNLYELYGKEKFNMCMKKYCDKYKFKIAGKEQFTETAEGVLGNISGLIEGWLGEKIVATTFAEK